MRPALYSLTLIVLLLHTSPALAQCSGGSCGRSAAWPVSTPTVQDNSYRWIPTASANQVALYRGDEQVGCWVHSESVYYRLDPTSKDRWQVADCPTALPEGARRKVVEQNHGLDTDKLKEAGEGYWINGRKVSRAEAIKAVEQGLPDDAHLPRVTIIAADDALRKRVRDDLISWQGRIVVQDYAPDAWAITPGFVRPAPGKVVVYIQAPSGTVLHRQDDYDDGATGLSKALTEAAKAPATEAVRKPGPYDPGRDLDLRKPRKPKPDPNVDPDQPQPSPSPAGKIPPWVPCVACGAVVMLLLGGKKKE